MKYSYKNAIFFLFKALYVLFKLVLRRYKFHLFLFFCVNILFYSYIYYNYNNDTFLHQHSIKIKEIVSDLAKNTTEFIFSPTATPELNRLIKLKTKEIEGLKYIIITDENDTIIAHNLLNFIGSKLELNQIHGDDVINFSELILIDGEKVGSVHLTLLKSYINSLNWKDMKFNFFMFIYKLLITFTTALLIFNGKNFANYIVEISKIVSDREIYFPIARLQKGGMSEIYWGKRKLSAGHNYENVILKIKNIREIEFSKSSIVNQRLLIRFIISMIDNIKNRCIKIQKLDLFDQQLLESKNLMGLNHSNIVKFYDFNPLFKWIAMEYVHGINLKELLFDKEVPVNIGKTIYIILEICEALKHTHEKDILHNDIKPENIIISSEGHIKLADYGISSNIGYETDFLAATMNYMSPERFFKMYLREKGQHISIDVRSDIFSLGIVFYEMLSGKKLFDFKKFKEALHTIPNIDQPPIMEINSNVSQELNDIVMKCIEIDKTERFQNIEELIDKIHLTIKNHSLVICRQNELRQFMQKNFQPDDFPKLEKDFDKSFNESSKKLRKLYRSKIFISPYLLLRFLRYRFKKTVESKKKTTIVLFSFIKNV